MSEESIEFRILKVSAPVLHQYKVAGKFVVLYIFICICLEESWKPKILDRRTADFPVVKHLSVINMNNTIEVYIYIYLFIYVYTQ